MPRFSMIYGLLTVALLTATLSAADWPQYRFDSARGGASPTDLPKELHLGWTRDLPAPRPAFAGEVRLRFDRSYEPVVLGKTMFVPSMVTDSVTALDTESGAVRWRFVTDGPVRFAPLAWEGKVYVASDDGYLYCLAATSGDLLWKFRGLPAEMQDRKLLGNRRLVSLWPARGGPVLQDGVVYFAAGLWPANGVFVHALDAASGRPLWSNTTSNRIPEANMDHGVAHYAGITPQGYLALVNDHLVVPCGAQLPAFLHPETGVLGNYTMGWGGRVGLPKGSWFVAGAGKYLSTSGDLYDLSRVNDEKFKDSRGRPDFKNMLYPGGYTRLLIDPTNQRELGNFRQPVITEEALYQNESGTIVAYDLSKLSVEDRGKSTLPAYRQNDRYPDKLKANLPLLWKLASKNEVHIKAGNRLYTGGPGTVEAIELSPAGKQPAVAWQKKIEGAPHRMLAADDRLFVVTQAGRIYCFAADAPARVSDHRPQATPPAVSQAWSKRVDDILNGATQTDGYALVLGVADPALVVELVRQSSYFVIAVDPDEKKVAALRSQLQQAGWYATRATAHVGDPQSFPFPPYLANLVVAGLSQQSAKARSATIAAVYRTLRPYGGSACLTVAENQIEPLAKQIEAAKLSGSVVEQQRQQVVVRRAGPLPGAADWSHEEATAANTGASPDQFLRPPLGMLWFDGSLRWHRKPGSAVVRVAQGRIFVLADKLHALDVYTGRRLWETAVPDVRSATSEVVAVGDAVYVTAGKTCLAFSPTTGRSIAKLNLPADAADGWSNIHVEGDYLIGQSGKRLVCFDRRSGETAWQFTCSRSELSIALGAGKVICAEVLNRRRGETEQSGAKTRAFDLKTGEIVWQFAGGSLTRYSAKHDLVVCDSGIYRAADGEKLRDNSSLSPIVGSSLIAGTSDSFMVYDLLSGKQQGDELKWYRRGCTGLRASANLVTTRFRGNAAYVDLATREIEPLWNIRSGCNNNLFPADGVLNVPNVTGGCECNYTPASQAFVPVELFELPASD